MEALIRTWFHANYHLDAKHVAASTKTAGAVEANGPGLSRSKRCQQATLDQMTGLRAKISKSTSDKLTNSLMKWVSHRVLSVVEDKGLESVLEIATADLDFQLLCRKTISGKRQQLYDNEKQAKHCGKSNLWL